MLLVGAMTRSWPQKLVHTLRRNTVRTMADLIYSNTKQQTYVNIDIHILTMIKNADRK